MVSVLRPKIDAHDPGRYGDYIDLSYHLPRYFPYPLVFRHKAMSDTLRHEA